MGIIARGKWRLRKSFSNSLAWGIAYQSVFMVNGGYYIMYEDFNRVYLKLKKHLNAKLAYKLTVLIVLKRGF